MPSFVHVDVKYLPQMADETRRRYQFVAIDRATRWVYVALKADKTARSARTFLNALAKAAPLRIQKLLTDNGTELTDRLFGSRARAPTGTHEFDRLCAQLGIEHRLTPPRHPQTNGMVERFNGRIADLLRTDHFRSSEDLEQTLHRYVTLYNHHLLQKALNHVSLIQAMKRWPRSHPKLFLKRAVNRPGCDMPNLRGKGRINFIARPVTHDVSNGIETYRDYRRQLNAPSLVVMPCNLCGSDASFNPVNAHAIKQLAETVKDTASHLDGIPG